MIEQIVQIARGVGFDVVPLIDHYALNVELDKRHGKEDAGYYVMLPKQEERRYNDYGLNHYARVELVATEECPFSDSDREDYKNVSAVSERLKQDLLKIIEAVLTTGEYENVDRISFFIVPYRYDSFHTAVTATFDISTPESPC